LLNKTTLLISTSCTSSTIYSCHSFPPTACRTYHALMEVVSDTASPLPASTDI